LNKMSKATRAMTPQGSPGENPDTAFTRLTVDQAHNLVDAELNQDLKRRGLPAKGRRGERMKRLVVSIRARDCSDEAQQAAAQDAKTAESVATTTGEDTTQEQPPDENHLLKELTDEDPRGDEPSALNPRGDDPSDLESSQEGVAIEQFAAQALEHLDKELTEVLALDTKVNEKIQSQEQQSEIAAQQDEARDNRTLAEASETIQHEEKRDRKLMELFASTNKAQLKELFDNR
jgi:hypothetical protein